MAQWVGFAIGFFIGVAFGSVIMGALLKMREDWRVEHPTFPVEQARREEA